MGSSNDKMEIISEKQEGEIESTPIKKETGNDEPTHPRHQEQDDMEKDREFYGQLIANLWFHNTRLPPPGSLLQQPPFHIAARILTSTDSGERVDIRSNDYSALLYIRLYAERNGMAVEVSVQMLSLLSGHERMQPHTWGFRESTV
ncbi:hypothetical protein PT974_12128 [Cladobotryum mycophilum]|uniref:Uncharacterized protein n=1 Tax=Cladobotryum mycophilum TaxID=491253 RepID=A0ABR0S833_9HYPO